MSFGYTPDQHKLRGVMRSFFAQKSPPSAVRRLMDDPTGHDSVVWQQLVQQLGVAALHVPEHLGGAGAGLREVGAVFEEAGRVLACVPMLSSFLTVQALLSTGDEPACKELLPGLMTGDTLGALAWLPEAGRGATTVKAQAGRLTGTASYVVDGHVADLLLVHAWTDEGLSLYAVDGAAAGLRRTPLRTLDQTRRQCRLDLDGIPGRLVGDEGGAEGPLLEVLDRAAVLLAAEAVGGAEEALQSAVQYACTRHQFGRAIGSFQAVKHKCADMYVLVQGARAAAEYALWAADERPDDFPAAASIAKAYCSEAFSTVAAESIQVHGGIGFTWEHPAHLYFKRATSSELLLGTPAQHRERIAEQVGLAAALPGRDALVYGVY